MAFCNDSFEKMWSLIMTSYNNFGWLLLSGSRSAFLLYFGLSRTFFSTIRSFLIVRSTMIPAKWFDPSGRHDHAVSAQFFHKPPVITRLCVHDQISPMVQPSRGCIQTRFRSGHRMQIMPQLLLRYKNVPCRVLFLVKRVWWRLLQTSAFAPFSGTCLWVVLSIIALKSFGHGQKTISEMK